MELLVAVLVAGVAALGVGKLTLLSAQSNRAALQQSMATMLAETMLERIQANPDQSYPNVALGQPPGPFEDCLASVCTPRRLADFDVSTWKCSLGRWRDEAACVAARAAGFLADAARQPGLPEGDGAIAIVGRTAVVTVAWGDAAARRVTLCGRS